MFRMRMKDLAMALVQGTDSEVDSVPAWAEDVVWAGGSAGIRRVEAGESRQRFDTYLEKVLDLIL